MTAMALNGTQTLVMLVCDLGLDSKHLCNRVVLLLRWQSGLNMRLMGLDCAAAGALLVLLLLLLLPQVHRPSCSTRPPA